MANVERGVAVAGALNRYVRRLYDHRTGFDDTGFALLQESADAIEAIVADINQPNRERENFSELIDRLITICDSAQTMGEAELHIEGPPANEEAPIPVPDVIEDVAEEAPEVEAVDVSEADYDSEIAAIFAEESAELLESADREFEAWRSDKTAAQPLEELKRDLHTLKGGARMAGITSMGNLSHEIETLLMSIERGAVEVTPSIEELLLASIDELHRMRDLVLANKPVPPALAIERRMQQANAGEVITRPGAEEAPVAEVVEDSAPFSPEPDETISMVILDSPLDNELATIGFVDDDGEGASAQDTVAHEPATDDAEQDVPQEPAVAEGDAADETEAAPASGGELATVEGSSGESEPDSASEAEAEDIAMEIVEAAADDDDAGIEQEVYEEAAEQAPPDEVVEQEPPDEAVSEPFVFAPQPPAEASEPAELRPIRTADNRQEVARVDAELLENLLNAAGEISIYHSRLNQQVSSFEFHVEEFEATVQRLREQLRKLEIETEAQIMAGHQETMVARDFDPLELDRYSNIQQLSRALAESANDLDSLKDLLSGVTREAESLLVQQSRVTAELQDGLMRTRMVPFERHVPRLTRLVRQAATESGKRAELAVEGASGELDRQVLDKMLPPFQHMLRNAVVHGIESPEIRQAADKPAVGRITIRLQREGAEMVIDVADDGAGLDVGAIRRKAYELGLLAPDAEASDEEIMTLILRPGFSTAGHVTQSAGRGVGMDVVANEIKKLGGSLQISSVTGQGTNFTVRLPFTLAITQALIVRTGDEVYALPLPSVEGVARIPRAELENMLSQSEPSFQYGEQTYRFRHLGMYLGGKAAQLPEEEAFIPVILVRAGEFSAALLTDEMIASQEIVVKSVGPQLSSIRGVAGATILGDGRIVLILDINALVRSGAPVVELKSAAPAPVDDRPLALVVDDSITVRRVTERFLQRNGMRVVTAKDGLDAIGVLSDHKPDVILLDIEMPRMDGYEFASHVRNDDRVADVPIIMITSRVGDKHRARAIELGVNDYLGKPYQDAQLMEAIQRQLEDKGVPLA